jgi:hypothetical protein
MRPRLGAAFAFSTASSILSAPTEPASTKHVTPSARHAAGQFLRAGRVRVDVDQSRHDQLAARVDRLQALSRDIGFDGGYFSTCDRDVAYLVQLGGRIDHSSAFDHEVVRSGECARNRRQHRESCTCRMEKVTSSHHGGSPLLRLSSAGSGRPTRG